MSARPVLEIESEAWWKLVYKGIIKPASDRPLPNSPSLNKISPTTTRRKA